jgi:hypothetical protein
MEFVETIIIKGGVVLKIHNKSNKTITIQVNYYDYKSEEDVSTNMLIECKPGEIVISKEMRTPIRMIQCPEYNDAIENFFSGKDISLYKDTKSNVISFDDKTF